MSESQTTEQELTPAQVAELADAQLVDVRTTAEYQTSHLAGARHVPLDRIPAVATDFDAQRPLVFYCRVGERSALAAEAFRGAGFDAYTLAGGLVAWAEEGRPVEPEGAEVAQHSSIPDF
jgi:rhodanese-related sulfurtransferase